MAVGDCGRLAAVGEVYGRLDERLYTKAFGEGKEIKKGAVVVMT